jgi:hypothetical protein
MKAGFLLVVAFFFFSFRPSVCHSQIPVRCILINKSDSTLIRNALVHIIEVDKQIVTNQNGEFEFTRSSGTQMVTMAITAIGIKDRISYKLTFENPEKVYVDVKATSLDDVTFQYLSPHDIVEKAVKLIPQNNVNKSYFGYSRYRQYQKQNGRFQNLFEANPIVMFQVSNARKYLSAHESFATRSNRQSQFRSSKVSDDKIHIGELLKENPIYHLDGSSLFPSKLSTYFFEFDSTSEDDEYRINYRSNYSSEIHGWENYHLLDYHGESYEVGKIVIDKSTFAFKSINRRSFRYPDYHYPKNNNFLHPNLKFYAEFVDANLNISFTKSEQGWYLKDINHMYTMEYYDTYAQKKTYVISDIYELTFDSISRKVDYVYVKNFFPKLLNNGAYDVMADDELNFPYYFFPKKVVWDDLRQDGQVGNDFFYISNTGSQSK